MDVRAFPVGNVLIFFCQTAGLLCLPCGKCFLVFLIVEAFQNRRIKTSGQPLDDFVRVARVVYSFFLFVQRHLLFRSTHPVDTGSWNPKCGKSGPHPLEAGKITSRNAKIPARSALPPVCAWNRSPGRITGRQSERMQLSENNDIAMKIKCFPDKRARRAEAFHFPLFFYERAQSGRISLP